MAIQLSLGIDGHDQVDLAEGVHVARAFDFLHI
jgi:hypothetical protein